MRRPLVVIGALVFVFLLTACDMCMPTAKKPVIYIYPEHEQEITVQLEFQGRLTVTWPPIEDGWRVTAKPDGTLTDEAGIQYYCLFWEGVATKRDWDLRTGFVVPGSKTGEFLQESLATLGLNPKEINEFIIYWLPEMQDSKFNLIHFAGEDYQQIAPLTIDPVPDTLIRVFMVWKPLRRLRQIEPQILEAPQRTGFTVVEWGGARLP